MFKIWKNLFLLTTMCSFGPYKISLHWTQRVARSFGYTLTIVLRVSVSDTRVSVLMNSLVTKMSGRLYYCS
jgi:hypothetical protein